MPSEEVGRRFGGRLVERGKRVHLHSVGEPDLQYLREDGAGFQQCRSAYSASKAMPFLASWPSMSRFHGPCGTQMRVTAS